jgi:ketosteroid isomerase-like protein
MDNLADAIRSKDVNAITAQYAPDVLAFDLLPPLQYSGADAIRKRVSEWFSSFQGSIGFEMRNLSITAGDDVAYCYSLNGVSGTTKGGAKVDMWWRATNCFRKIDGNWFVTHGHSSEPFDMESGKALLDLKP